VGTLLLVPKVGFSLFPASEKPMFLIKVEMPEGTNLYETDRVVKYVESKLKDIPEIRYYNSNVGKGNPRIYYNVIQKNEASNYGEIFVLLQKHIEPTEKLEIIDKLRAQFSQYPNAKIQVKNFEQGPLQDAPVAIRILGENLDTLKSLAVQVERIMEKTDGTIYINNPLKVQPTDLKVTINKDKAGMLGIPISEIDKTIRLGIAGLNIGKMRDENGDDYTLTVTIPKSGKMQDLSAFDKLYVTNVVGTTVPLRQVADIAFETSPNQIRHYDKERFVTVSTFVKTGFLVENVNNAVVEKLANIRLPKGYTFKIAGEVESKEESFGGLGTIIIITLFGFIGVLILEFKTFKSTLIVLSVIPLGIIGAVLILYFTGVTFSFTTMIGLIALVGIEVKNSILLVDFTNQLRERGMPLDQAIKEAGETRFVPIVLT
ncbi:MAG: efflux RND transporter permease subunit, partial [Cytophagales bacterium]|nr:efflux RND transporter permease subunit [Cytophagales bacterium]